MQSQIITASLFIVRTAQIVRRAFTIASFFLPVALNATRLAAAYIVLAACFVVEKGMTVRDYTENKLCPAIALFLNECCYFVNPHLAPAATPVDYFPEIESQETDTVSCVETTEVDPWILPLEAVVVPTQTQANNIKPLLLLPPAKSAITPSRNQIADLTIRELKKRASNAKIRNYNVMTKAQLVEALSA